METEIRKVTNLELMILYKNLKHFFSNSTIEMPINFNFYLYQNIKEIEKLIPSIEEFCFKKFQGKQFDELTLKEQEDYDTFCNLENDVKIIICPLSTLDGVKLSLKEYQSIDFMIKEN